MAKLPCVRLGVTALVLALGLSSPSTGTAQSLEGWRVRFEGGVGLFKATRDIGKITGSEVESQIKNVLQTAPVFQASVVAHGPSPHYTLRGRVGYLSTDTRGQSGACAVLEGEGCLSIDVPTTAVSGGIDLLLHSERGEGTMRYFVAGLGIRSYSFDERDCLREGQTDPNFFAVCSPMMEFLGDQRAMVGRIGIGLRGAGPIGWSLEAVDEISQFKASGLRGEGGIQNDLVFSVGLVFPGR